MENIKETLEKLNKQLDELCKVVKKPNSNIVNENYDISNFSLELTKLSNKINMIKYIVDKQKELDDIKSGKRIACFYDGDLNYVDIKLSILKQQVIDNYKTKGAYFISDLV